MCTLKFFSKQILLIVIHGRDEFADLPEAHSTLENGGTEVHGCIAHHKTIVKEEREKDGGVRACPKKFLGPRPLECQKMPFWNIG